MAGLKISTLKKSEFLKPDLIIANKEENEKEQIEELQKEFNVIVTDIKTLDDNYKMIEEIGKLTQTENKAAEIIENTKRNFKNYQHHYHPLSHHHFI